MSCLCRGDRDADGLKISHLAHKNHIGILAQRGAQCIGIGLRIQPDLPLVYDCLFVLVEVLNRVLERDHMHLTVIVDLVDNGGKSRGFAASGRACDEYQASLFLVQINDRCGHAQHLRRRHDCVHQTKCQGCRAALLVHIDPVTPLARNGKGHIHFPFVLKALLLRVIHHRVGDLHRIWRKQAFPLHCDQFSIDPHLGRNAHRDMYVRCPRFFCCCQDLLNCLCH